MTYPKRLQKHRAAYCSQNYTEIRLRCPVCLLIKKPRHCKIYKNTAALWWHLRQEHGEFVYSQFTSEDVLDVLNNMSKAIKWGIIPNERYCLQEE